MRVNLITHLSNGAGLQRDYELLRAELERRGHVVHGIHFKTPIPQPGDLNIFLEVCVEALLACAPRNFLVPNPEWFLASWPLDRFDRVLTKTHDATAIFQALVGDRCTYLGWQATDFYDPTIPREPRFLHVAGKSRSKNTPAVLEGARRADVPLTVIAHDTARVTDDELRTLLNSHAFCLLPSAYEGYGHALHEAYGCAQVVLTTDRAPMNETTPYIGIPSRHRRRHHAAGFYEVAGKDVARAIRQALALSEADRVTMGQQVRAAFLADRAAFQQTLDAVLQDVQACAA